VFFDITLGVHKADDENVIYREAVRSVSVKDGKFLMIRTRKGDYKFPGGGPKSGESLEEALIREVREETGFNVERVKKKIGTATERKPDKYVKSAVFEMISHYYLCDVSENSGAQELDEYEKALDFRPHWVSIDDAIENNENFLRSNADINPWVQRLSAEQITILAEKAFGNYCIIRDIRELNDGFFNSGFLIDLDGCRKMVLKVSPIKNIRVMRYEKNIMDTEVYVLNKLNSVQGVPAPKVLPTKFP